MSTAHRRQALGRRAVMVWAISFIALQAAMALTLDGPLAKLRHPEHALLHQRLRPRMNEHSQRSLLLVLGSSRTMNGLDAGRLNRDYPAAERPLVFNSGLPGHTVVHQYIVLESLLDRGLRPDGLVLEVAPPLLARNLHEDDYLPTHVYTRREMKLAAALKDDAEQVRSEWRAARVIPAFSYRFHLMNALLPSWRERGRRKNHWVSVDEWGWLKISPEKRPDDPRPLIEKEFGAACRHFAIADPQRRAMHRLLHRCEEIQLPVVLMLMPEGPCFRSLYSDRSRQVLQEFLDELQRDYHLRTVDGRHWIDAEEDFYDSHHLVETGASKFTSRFEQEVMPLFCNPADRPLLSLPNRVKGVASTSPRQ